MSKLDPWSPRVLAALRIMTALLVIQHATMKFFAFPRTPGVGRKLGVGEVFRACGA